MPLDSLDSIGTVHLSADLFVLIEDDTEVVPPIALNLESKRSNANRGQGKIA